MHGTVKYDGLDLMYVKGFYKIKRERKKENRFYEISSKKLQNEHDSKHKHDLIFKISRCCCSCCCEKNVRKFDQSFNVLLLL